MMNRSKKKIVGYLLLLVALLLCVSYFVLRWHSGTVDDRNPAELDKSAQDYQGKKDTYTGKKNTDTIDIPGFDSMTFKAGELVQRVNLHNPKENTCYFKLSLYLNDGTKLWESQFIEPGKGLYEISLTSPLPVGEYQNCQLKYECFKMNKEQTPLNGSEIKLTIHSLE